MNVSVIVPTFNGAGKIGHLLEALIKQSERDFELIVVVDGSTDNTLDVLSSYDSRFESLHVIALQNSGRSKVRNCGVEMSSGDLLIFYDDDMVPFTDSVKRHIGMQSQGGMLVTGYPLELKEKDKTDVQNYKARLNAKWMLKYSADTTTLSSENLFFTAANCSMPRLLFDQLRGFDERLTDAEDHDLAVRALTMKMEVVFDRKNKAIHREFITAKSYLKRMREYSASHQKMGTVNSLAISTKRSPIFYKRWIYALFAHSFWVKCIDNEYLMFLPSFIRYKLYDVIFQVLAIEHPHVKV